MDSYSDHAQARVYLVGDSTFDIRAGLLFLLREGHNPLLQSFFRAAYQVIRVEVASLVSTQRACFPRFSSIQDLLALHRQTSLHPALHQALVCTFQLATFISRSANQDALPIQQADSYLVGLCTGGLAAAVVSSSRDVNDLLTLAPHAVGVAFRTAICAYEVGQSIERGINSWSIAVTNQGENEIRTLISDFSAKQCLPIVSQPFLSAVTEKSITVTGPPSVLRALRESKLAAYGIMEVPLYAPYHAQHLFTADDVDSVLGMKPDFKWSRYTSQIPIISSTTGAIKPTRDYHGLLRSVVEDILINPISWKDLINGVAYVSRFSSQRLISIYPIGTKADIYMRNALGQSGYTAEIASSQSEPFSQVLKESAGDRSPGAYASASGKSKIAIVGMSGRFPEADNPEVFWDLLFQGLDVHKVVPPSRWNAATHVDPTGKQKSTSRTPYGCWLNNPGGFDAKFFNVTPREAPQMDPASRLALMTAYEAMENAGMVPGTTPSTQKDRVGVAYGVTSNDWMETNSAQNIDTFFIPGGCRAFIPGRVNYFFRFGGPSLTLDTACSSSLSAIHTACNLLWQGDADTVITGGTNILTNPDFTAGLDRGYFLSRTGNCKSFDQAADGYCRAEGVCTVVIKRLDDAIAEGDPILGVILGAGTNHSAEAASITRPLADAQKQVISKILNDASVDPVDVSYVEMHGTGTPTGDPIEMESVVDTFAPAAPLSREASNPLYVGAVKANVGHGEAVAGVTSLAKVLLMMKHGTIPPHAGLRTKLNEKFPPDMWERNVRIASRPLEWKLGNTPRKAFINNFSAAGGNSALLIEDAPVLPLVQGTDVRSSHIITVSAKTAVSLKRNIHSLLAFLDQDYSCTGITLPTLSYTTTARRTHHPYRIAVRGSDLEQIKGQLHKALECGNGSTRPRISGPRVTFAFTGNGSQYTGMGKHLFESFPSFRADMVRFDQMVQRQGFRSIVSLCSSATGPIDDFDTIAVQVATICLELALARLCMSWGIKPASVVGHSLGEYAALAVAGVLSEADAIFLVARRAQLLQERCQQRSHAMLAAHASRDEIDHLLPGRPCEVACINGPEDVVLSGTVDELRHMKDLLQRQKVKATMLSAPYAFHSMQVDPILEDFETACQGVTFHKPTVPVICPLLCTVVAEAGTFSPRYLRRQCREPVNMLDALREAHSSGVLKDYSTVVEFGPQPTTCGMIKNIFGSTMTTLAFLKRGQDTFAMVTQSLSSLYALGCDMDWREYHSGFPSSHRVVQLPAYSWDLKDYWIQYVHDWSLRKGDPVPDSLKAPIKFIESSTPAAVVPLAAVVTPKLESTTIHAVVQDSLVGKNCSIIVDTDLSREDIRSLAQGHKVDEIPLVTPSVYAEIALRVGTYIVEKYQPHLKGYIISVEEMAIHRALVSRGGPHSQILRSTVSFDLETSTATCHFTTMNAKTKKTQQHSQCQVRFRQRSEALSTPRARVKPSQSRIDALDKEASRGNAYRFSKTMVYRMVHTLAKFDPDYRQVDEIVLSSGTMDASSTVSFGSLRPSGSFHTNPAAIDALSQSAGFIMNGNENADLEKDVFVNHGWRSFQLFEAISATKTYHTYCKMEEREAKRWEGNLLVLDGDRVVAWFGGINLQGVPRRVLKYILSTEDGAHSKSNVAQQTRGTAPKSVQQAHSRTQPAASPAVSRSSSSSKVQRVLQLFSEETGISPAELTEASEFAEMGVDSLLSLQLASRLREDMDIIIEPAVFATMTTIKDLCEFVDADGVAETPHEEVAVSAPAMESHVGMVEQSPAETNDKFRNEEFAHIANESVGQTVSNELITRALEIIAEESGVGIDELTDDVVFTEMGVDSLLSLMVVARYREELGLETPSSASIFTDFGTVRDLKRFLGARLGATPPAAAASTGSSASSVVASDADESLEIISGISTPALNPDKEAVPTRYDDVPVKDARRASSVVLQGRPGTDPQTLLLFPDGSGSAGSYTGMAPVRGGLAIVGLNCPYFRHPGEMDGVTFDALMRSYLNEVRRRQPSGPYRLGGWSAGGILAFRAAQLLVAEGERVDSLVLIDAPPPTGLDPLPARWYEHCATANIFGNMPGSSSPSHAPPPPTLVPHFRAVIKMLQHYRADPLPKGSTPRTSIAWAGKCVFDGSPGRSVFETRPGDPEGIKFLTQRRTDWTAGAWAPLFPLDEPTVSVMEGQDHFSMMGGANGEILAKFVSDATLE